MKLDDLVNHTQEFMQCDAVQQIRAHFHEMQQINGEISEYRNILILFEMKSVQSFEQQIFWHFIIIINKN